jgi:TRAP transporter TAXI family solute receptor
VYYPAGGAIAKLVNKQRKMYNIRVTVVATGGSVDNINAVISGELTFGIAQSDRQFQAFRGMAEWRTAGPQTDLRSVFTVHAETVCLVAATDAGIRSVADLKGKRVSIGNIGSGYRQNAIDALVANNLDYKVDLQVESTGPFEAPGLLQDGRIDAFFYTVGHPNDALREATGGRRKVRFIPIENIDNLIRLFPYYTKATVPVWYYPGAVNHSGVQTFGVKATLVTSAKVPNRVVFAVTKEVLDNIDVFRELHPACGNLKVEDMVMDLSAPIHPGAMWYYQEIDLR